MMSSNENVRRSLEVGIKRFFLPLAVTALICMILLGIGSQKSGFHVDEIYTFGLSNHPYSESDSIRISLADGVPYNGEEIWQDYTGVRESGRFDYANVFENQAHDVHPPLYYLLIHTISSMFPKLPVLWVGLLLNIPLACVVFWQMVWIAHKIGMKKRGAVLFSMFYVLGAGFVDYAVVFFRMYALLSVMVNALVMVFLKFPAEEKGNFRYYITLGFILLGGMMTQYYFLIYAFFLCVVYLVYLVVFRNWKKIILSILTAMAAIGTGILIFPASLDQIFGGYRGREAIENARVGELGSHLWNYLGQMSRGIFGGFFPAVLFILLCLVIVYVRKKEYDRNALRSNLQWWCLMVLPVCLYVVVIAKIAPYQTLRYVIAVMAPLYLAMFNSMVYLVPSRGKKYVLLLAAVFFVCGYRQGLENLYLGDRDKISQVEAHSDAQGIYLYKEDWKILSDYPFLRYMDNIIFWGQDDWQEKISVDYNCDTMIVYVTNCEELNQKEVLSQMMAGNKMNSCKKIFQSGYTTAYYLQCTGYDG